VDEAGKVTGGEAGQAPSAAALGVARDVFGLPALRPGQAEVIAAAEAGRDVLFVAPTGSGKSVAYWVPALVSPGLTLVVSPLIALMTDQVVRLRRAGVAAAAIHSQLDPGEQREALVAALDGRLRFLYVAPERLATPSFEERLAELAVARFVVDEAHCISSWGNDFRQEYRRLAAAVTACGRPPVTAVTATATPQVREDISRSLTLRRPFTVVTGFVRIGLTLEVQRCRQGAEKLRAVTRALAEVPGRALVYCGRIRDCEETAEALRADGVAAAAYHGGLDGPVRGQVQAAFTEGRLRVVVATSAFGMGVDIPDIRQVIHRDFPACLEDYHQAAGRAGRDGLPARCLLLYNPADRGLQELFIEQSYPEREVVREVYRALLRAGRWDLQEAAGLVPSLDRRAVEASVRLLENAGALLPGGGVRRLAGAPVDFEERRRLKEAALARLDQMMAYATSRECRHARIADYFGEQGVARSCSACDNCLSPRSAERPVPEPAVRAALRAVARFDGHLGGTRLAAMLRGADSSWNRDRPWVRELDFFGALAGWEEEAVRELLVELVERELVLRGHGERPTLGLAPAGRAVLSGELEVTVSIPGSPRPARSEGPAPPRHAAGRRPDTTPAKAAAAAASGDELDAPGQLRFERLRRWRLGLARAEARAAFTIFDDRTLREIAERDPRSVADLLRVRGVGPSKSSRYGEAVIGVLRDG
jgi:RecQ family ATP-dependent DNA helicase